MERGKVLGYRNAQHLNSKQHMIFLQNLLIKPKCLLRVLQLLTEKLSWISQLAFYGVQTPFLQIKYYSFLPIKQLS